MFRFVTQEKCLYFNAYSSAFEGLQRQSLSNCKRQPLKPVSIPNYFFMMIVSLSPSCSVCSVWLNLTSRVWRRRNYQREWDRLQPFLPATGLVRRILAWFFTQGGDSGQVCGLKPLCRHFPVPCGALAGWPSAGPAGTGSYREGNCSNGHNRGCWIP